jgi:membrane dipeptidase
VTSVPPFIRTLPEIVREHSWFIQTLGKQSKPARTAFFFGLQHPPEDASVSDLLLLKGLGIRFMTLAYEGVNEYGGGFSVQDEPLSEKGKELIRAMAETGIVLDLSHAGHRTARDAIRFIEQQASLEVRVVATHTACFDLYDHGRGLPDDILRSVANLGGLIGLVTVTWMLDKNDDSIQPFLRHLNHLVDLVGDTKVCLGTDGVYHRLDLREAEERFKIMKDKIDPRGVFRARHPEQPEELNCPERLRVIEQQLRLLGWSKNRIEKIIGRNLIGFLSKL